MRRVVITFFWLLLFASHSSWVLAEDRHASPEFKRYSQLSDNKQYKEAIDLVFEAADKGAVWAKMELADLCQYVIKPQALTPEQTEALSWLTYRLELREKAGDANAQYVLGLKYLSAEFTESNLVQGVALLNKAADQGHQGAILYLSAMDRNALAAKGIISKYAKEYSRDGSMRP